jgi:CBS domain-containing protein
MTPLPLAKEIMVTKLTTVGPEDDVLRGIRLLLHHRITGAPVVKSDRTYLGMLSEGSCMRVLFLTAREAGPETRQAPKAREFMSKKLLTLRPESDAVDAISTLLKHRFSGAPVVDEDLNFLGVFSERYIMRLLINSAYEQLPSTPVKAFMNTDRGRLIEEDTDLLVVARMFLDTYYRRLPVLRDGKLVGQVSRRDVLNAEHHLARFVKGRRRALLDHRRGSVLGEVWHSNGEAPSTEISHFMDTAAETIDEGLDLLAIARIFLDTNRRRLPVLREGKLVGQISRRDLLLVVFDLLWEEPRHEQPGLYLSAVLDPAENPILQTAYHPSAGPSQHRS